MNQSIKQVHVQNFRNLEQYTLSCSPNTNIIIGSNGSGKTTLLESIYYGCFLRSFRTKSPREMIRFEADALHCTLTGAHNGEPWEIRTGLSKEKRKTTINNKRATSQKELLSCYQTLYLGSDDATLITGDPEKRRNFFDRTLLLQNSQYIQLFKRYNKVLKQRNALFQQPFEKSIYDIWTEELWDLSKKIQKHRQQCMVMLERKARTLLEDYFKLKAPITCEYIHRGYEQQETYQKFCAHNPNLRIREYACKHSCFGAHRDDISISWHNKKTKQFASRGQQKLVVLALKLAQAQNIPTTPIFLVDDFITDFDPIKTKQAAQALYSLQTQLFLTVPFFHQSLKESFSNQTHHIKTTQLDSHY